MAKKMIAKLGAYRVDLERHPEFRAVPRVRRGGRLTPWPWLEIARPYWSLIFGRTRPRRLVPEGGAPDA